MGVTASPEPQALELLFAGHPAQGVLPSPAMCSLFARQIRGVVLGGWQVALQRWGQELEGDFTQSHYQA